MDDETIESKPLYRFLGLAMSTTVLKCGDLTVYSPKALDRFKTAESRNIQIGHALYRARGMHAPVVQYLPESSNNIAYPLEVVEGEEETLSTKNECQAIFFDQTHYTFSIKLCPGTKSAHIFSPIASWCEASSWIPDAGLLTLPVNFGNDLGDFEVCWEWTSADDEYHRASFSGQVFSFKLDIYRHFRIMLKEVENKFNWIKLDLLRQTTWGWKHDSDMDKNMRTWLLIFMDVHRDMSQRYRKLLSQHRRRLVEESLLQRAEQIKKISPRLEEKVAEGLKDHPNKRYSVTRRVLDADTTENRYMKHILLQTIEQLNEIIDLIDGSTRFSDLFKTRLLDWSKSWSILKQHRFWRGIGSFRGLRRASLVLSQDPLYAGIRRSYLLLQQGLSFFEKDLRGGIQNAAQLYEVWCFVKLDQLLHDLGWTKFDEKAEIQVLYSDVLEYEKEDLRAGSVRHSYRRRGLSDDVELSLLFQPSATSNPNKSVWPGMMATPINQQPDLVLRVHRNDLPDQPVYTWIFDAKYRIKDNEAPEDAVNQMHRYRDAIVWSKEAMGKRQLSREGIGAYVLYPGHEKMVKNSSGQIASIDQTNIGAFTLRPNKKRTIQKRLRTHVENILHLSQDNMLSKVKADSYYYAVPHVNYPPRQYFIKCLTRKTDGMNTVKYWDTCRLYRLPLTVAIQQELDVNRLGYLVPVNEKDQPLGAFPIQAVRKRKRFQIKQEYDSASIPMYEKPSAEDDEYYLFVLGDMLDTIPEITRIPSGQIFLVDETVHEVETPTSS